MLRNSRRVTGPAAKRFHSSAIGKFFSTVPTQTANSSVTGARPGMTLNSSAAAMLIVGHITSTVQPDTISVMKNGLSCPGRMILPASA